MEANGDAEGTINDVMESVELCCWRSERRRAKRGDCLEDFFLVVVVVGEGGGCLDAITGDVGGSKGEDCE